MARNFEDIGVFLRLTIYVYTYIILECLILFGYFMLYQTTKKIASRPVQRNPAFGENLQIFAFFGCFFLTTFRRFRRLFLNSFFHMRNLHCNDRQNQNKLVPLSPKKFHFWGKLTKSLDFWLFFSPNFQNNCTFVLKLLFLNENSII